MATLSLCMIVKDEEGTLERCLSSVISVVDEIIIMDTGSTDRTKEVAAMFTEKIYDFDWIDDFSAARNASFDRATKDYIIWLDADDIILLDDMVRLKELKENMPNDIDVVMLRYNTAFDDKGRITFYCYRERIVKASRRFKWKEPVHEYIETSGRTLDFDISVTHAKERPRLSGRNLKIYEKQISAGKELSARGMYYYARELKDNGEFAKSVAMFTKFLDSGMGWIEDNIAACGELAKCLLELGDGKSALMAMQRSFEYDNPRAEICCLIGSYFRERKIYKQAVFWYELALSLKKTKNIYGFCQRDCWDYIPSLECAVCYYYLGEYEKAEKYNELAGKYKPDSPQVLYNRTFFQKRI